MNSVKLNGFNFRIQRMLFVTLCYSYMLVACTSQKCENYFPQKIEMRVSERNLFQRAYHIMVALIKSPTNEGEKNDECTFSVKDGCPTLVTTINWKWLLCLWCCIQRCCKCRRKKSVIHSGTDSYGSRVNGSFVELVTWRRDNSHSQYAPFKRNLLLVIVLCLVLTFTYDILYGERNECVCNVVNVRQEKRISL